MPKKSVNPARATTAIHVGTARVRAGGRSGDRRYITPITRR